MVIILDKLLFLVLPSLGAESPLRPIGSLHNRSDNCSESFVLSIIIEGNPNLLVTKKFFFLFHFYLFFSKSKLI